MARTAAVGERVRRLRSTRGLSLRDLARTSGVSAPMLSQVERGETSPTLDVAARIAAGLELSLSQLLRLDESPHVAVVRAGERRRVRRDGHRIEELTPPLPGQPHSVTLHELKAGSRTGEAPLHEPGSRETAIVQSGTLTFVCGGQSVELSPGDAVSFDADLPHRFECKRDASFLAVVTAGLRRA